MRRPRLAMVAARSGLAVLTAACAGLAVLATATSTVASSTVTRIVVGSQRTVVSGLVDADIPFAKATFMQLPYAESFPSASGPRAPRVVLVSFSEHIDSRFYPERLRTERSVDGGKTFTQLTAEVPINSMTQLADGSLVALSPRTTPTTPSKAGKSPRTATGAIPASPAAGGVKQFETTFWRSHDYGATWAEQRGTISATDAYDSVIFHRGIVAGRDGSLLATTHGYLHGEHKYRSMLARSADSGATWRIVSTIASSPAGWGIEGRSEPTMARAAGGDLVVVMRQSAPISPGVCNGSRQGAGLVISRSTDDGASWTPAQSLFGTGLDPYNVSSADPHLTSMPGGQLLLSYGRPGTKILVSADGKGTSWSNLTATRSGMTSGYTSIVALTGTTALQVGDEGSNWCLRAGSGLHKVGIWAKTIELDTPDGNWTGVGPRYFNGSLTVGHQLP